MSARRSPAERDARRFAAIHLQIDRAHQGTRTALQVLDSSAASLAREAAEAMVRGDLAQARRWARAYQLVAGSHDRLRARQRRAYDAKLARQAAAHGIKAGDTVRVMRAGVGTGMPVGAVCTIDHVSGDILEITADSRRRILWAADVELVDEPAAEASPFQIGEDVLTPEGAGVVEHVDIVSGVTVRVAGETWRYEPGQLTRVAPAGVADEPDPIPDSGIDDEPACCDGTGWTGNPRTPCAEHYMHATDYVVPA